MFNSTTSFNLLTPVYIGIDAHTTNYTLSSLVKRRIGSKGNETNLPVLSTQTLAPELKSILKYCEECRKEVPNCTIFCAYEAGSLGYTLQRQLMAHGIDCVIMAPSTMVQSVRGKKFKNDKRDSWHIAECLASGGYSAVYIPDEHDEDIRGYLRMRDDHMDSLKRKKQQLNAYLLTLDIPRYTGKTKWTQAHRRWISGLDVSDMQKETIQEYMATITWLEDKISALDENIKTLSQQDRYATRVAYLRCFLGMEYNQALRLLVEVGDFKRFKKAGNFAAFLGLTPSDHSSSDNNNHGALTKAGNNALRKMIVESCQSGFSVGKPGFKSKALKARQKGCPAEVVAYADKGNVRLRRRFKRLIARQKERNKAIGAVAREYACFIWGMMTGHID